MCDPSAIYISLNFEWIPTSLSWQKWPTTNELGLIVMDKWIH
jgi:hypothetical protein